MTSMHLAKNIKSAHKHRIVQQHYIDMTPHKYNFR